MCVNTGAVLRAEHFLQCLFHSVLVGKCFVPKIHLIIIVFNKNNRSEFKCWVFSFFSLMWDVHHRALGKERNISENKNKNNKKLTHPQRVLQEHLKNLVDTMAEGYGEY